MTRLSSRYTRIKKGFFLTRFEVFKDALEKGSNSIAKRHFINSKALFDVKQFLMYQKWAILYMLLSLMKLHRNKKK